MTTLLIVGAYIIAQAVRDNGDKQVKNSPEYKKEIQKIHDKLWMLDNFYDARISVYEARQDKDKQGEKEWEKIGKEIKSDYYKKYPQSSTRLLPYKDWPEEQLAWKGTVDEKQAEMADMGRATR